MSMRRSGWLALVVALVTTGCAGAAGSEFDEAAAPTASVPPAPPAEVAAAPAETTTTVPSRVVHATGWAPFAATGPVTLLHPAARVERIGFHESNHDGAQQLTPLAGAAAPFTMESRERGTAPQGSADVVVDPEGEIRAPVTGTVKRAGTYVLYCRHSDDFAVIEPDARPGWEVKVLHIDGVQVRAGQRVEAGVTVLAPRPTPLPFESQIDEFTADPAWPHIHLEVVDPSIPDRKTGGGGGC